MASAKSKKSSKKPEDIEILKSDVASFASSLGLSTSQASSGFNDADFRKTGAIKPYKSEKKKQKAEKAVTENNQKEKNKAFSKDSVKHEKPKPKPPVLTLDDGNKGRGFDKFKNLPKLPLMKASSLGVWYADAADLEAKVIGEGKRVEVKNVDEWKSFVEKKKELGERLMAQYVHDYESSRGQSGDMRMLINTQRTGTAADKVSAFAVMIGDNPMANVRSLDALIGKFISHIAFCGVLFLFLLLNLKYEDSLFKVVCISNV